MRYLLLLLIVAGLVLAAACTDQAPPIPPATTPPTAPPVTTKPAPPATTAPGIPGTTAPEEIPPTVTHPHPPEWEADGTIAAGEYDGEATLANGRMAVYWKHDGTRLYMGLWGQTTGFVAIGFEPSSAMKDADMVLGYVAGGQSTVLDQYATGTFGPHPSDTELGGSYDILASGGSESGGVTVIEFSRNLDTGDRFDKALTPGNAVRFIWSMADADVPTVQHNIARGSGTLML
ncbi:MAG: hypothetical protein GKC05_03640 [Methanomicrobiales archaeon]|nr:hypothetical protein [Methanomicrobiales archaeon]NYT20463.1 hypothetical protein [Methanomicrobiales archaeon]